MAKDSSTIEVLLSLLARREVAPLYLLYGEEDFLIDEGVKAIVDAVLGDGERSFNLDTVSAADRDMREILAIASSFPMMAERRVVIIRDAERVTGKDADLLAGYCENPPHTTCLILVTSKPDFRRKPFTTIRRKGIIVESKPLYENQLPAWITTRAQTRFRHAAVLWAGGRSRRRARQRGEGR